MFVLSLAVPHQYSEVPVKLFAVRPIMQNKWRRKEHLDDEKVVKKENTVVLATVSEVVKGNYDVLYFYLTNGQVWRQIEPRNFRYPRKGEFNVMIDKGMMGDYRLRLDEKSPMTRIKRIR